MLSVASAQSHQMIGERRVGKVREDEQARPSLFIFRNKERDNLIELSPRL